MNRSLFLKNKIMRLTKSDRNLKVSQRKFMNQRSTKLINQVSTFRKNEIKESIEC